MSDKNQAIRDSAKIAWRKYNDEQISVIAHQNGKPSTACSDPRKKISDSFISREVDRPSFSGLFLSLGKRAGNLEALLFRSREHFAEWHGIFSAITEKRLYPVEQSLDAGLRLFVLYRCDSPLSRDEDRLAVNEDGKVIFARLGEGFAMPLPLNEDGTYQASPMIINEKVTKSDHDLMLRIAISFNQKLIYDHRNIQATEGEVDLRDVLVRNNWRKQDVPGKVEYWCEPGEKGISACIRRFQGTEFFTYLGHSVPFEHRKSYSAFQVLAFLEHMGNTEITGEVIANFLKQAGGPHDSGKIALGMKEEHEDGVPTDPTCIHFVNAHAWLKKPVKRPPPVITGVLDVGDKCLIIGPPKARKTFLAMQLALAIASGKDTLGFSAPTPHRVAYANMEIRPDNFQRRLRNMSNAFPHPITENLSIANLRGTGATLASIGEAIQALKPEVLIIDPLYKLYGKGHNENSAGDAATLMAEIEQLAKRAGCAVIIVHHDSKYGNDGQRTSRGAGSGLLSRDYDSALFMTPHAIEDDAVVVGHVLRNHRHRNDITIRWTDNAFILDDTLPALEETSATRRANRNRGISYEEVIEKVQGWITQEGMASSILQSRIIADFNKGKNAASSIVTLMCDQYGYQREKRQRTTMIFPPEVKAIIPQSTPPSA